MLIIYIKGIHMIILIKFIQETIFIWINNNNNNNFRIWHSSSF